MMPAANENMIVQGSRNDVKVLLSLLVLKVRGGGGGVQGGHVAQVP